MIALTACVANQWHALERDLLDLGYHADDIGTKLTICELISVVLAAPPGTAVHASDPSRWTRTDELIANLGEQQAGLLNLSARYQRGQVDTTPPPKALGAPGETFRPMYGIQMDALPVDEFTVKLREKQRKAREDYT